MPVEGWDVPNGYYAPDPEPELEPAMSAAEIELLNRIKDRIDTRLNNCLCEMKPGYDDSIEGFNEAWDIV